MSVDPIPSRLRDAVECDHRPVRPLRPSWMRAVLAITTLAVVLAFVFFRANLRSDIGSLPVWLSWGCSALQLGLGISLLGMAIRESVPGAGVATGALRSIVTAAVVVQVLVGIATSVLSPAIASIGADIGAGIVCMKHEGLLALPPFLVTLWLVFRALPLRAPTAGLLGGAGASVASDALIHLLCPVTDLGHVLVWHTGAVVLFMAVGWTIGTVWERLRWPRTS